MNKESPWALAARIPFIFDGIRILKIECIEFFNSSEEAHKYLETLPDYIQFLYDPDNPSAGSYKVPKEQICLLNTNNPTDVGEVNVPAPFGFQEKMERMLQNQKTTVTREYHPEGDVYQAAKTYPKN